MKNFIKKSVLILKNDIEGYFLKLHKEEILYKIIVPIGRPIYRFLYRPKIIGNEYIPKDGGVVLAGNHTKWMDCVMVMASCKRSVHFLAKSEIFKNPICNFIFTNSGLIPVHRERKDPDALRTAKEYLKIGAVIGIFPEGKVNKENRNAVLPLKMGAIKMAHDTNCPIVPFTINGKGKYSPFNKDLEIIFQEPYYVKSDDLEAERDILYQKISKNLK